MAPMCHGAANPNLPSVNWPLRNAALLRPCRKHRLNEVLAIGPPTKTAGAQDGSEAWNKWTLARGPVSIFEQVYLSSTVTRRVGMYFHIGQLSAYLVCCGSDAVGDQCRFDRVKSGIGQSWVSGVPGSCLDIDSD